MALKALTSNGKKYGVFWDWASIEQPAESDRGADRRLDADEQETFMSSLRALAMLYTHEHTTILRVTRFPDGFPDTYDLPATANVAAYADRGWTYCENLWAAWPVKETLDLALLAEAETPPINRQELMHLCGHAQERRNPPLMPEEFKESVEPKSFLNAKDDKPLVIELYESAFSAFFGGTRRLDFSGLGWGNSEIDKVCELLNSGLVSHIEFLHLASNNVRDAGMHKLAEVVANGKLPNCIKIVLDNNPGDETPVVDALQSQARKARMERLQKLWPSLNNKQKDSNRPSWAVLPTRMPTSDEEYLFQAPAQRKKTRG